MQYTNISWKEFYAKNANIVKLFKVVGMNNYVPIYTHSIYTIANERDGVVVAVRNENTSNLEKVLIDAKNGNPTWDQMMDTTFGFGFGCACKIIIYSGSLGGEELDEYTDEMYAVEGFSAINNFMGAQTYLVKVSRDDDKGDGEYIIELKDVPPIEIPKADKSKYTREYFNELEFWLRLSANEEPEPFFLTNPTDWIRKDEDDFSYDYLAEDVSFRREWNQSGCYIYIASHTADGMQKVEHFYNSHYTELYEIYRAIDVSFETKNDIENQISIKIFNRPFSCFVFASSEVKNFYVERIRAFSEKIEKLYYKTINEKGLS